jgi:hypothetical protein
MTKTSYPVPAPIYADGDYMADIIGYAKTADEAMARYVDYFAGTGTTVTGARKITPERRGEGPVDGWAPITDGY